MPEGKEGSPAAMNRTAVERKSDRELVVTRTFNAPAHIVFEAWSKPELFKRWWVPKSVGMSLLSCGHGCAHRGRVSLRLQSSGLRPTDGVLRHVQRSDAEQAPRLDERRKRSGRRDHGDVRRKCRQDAGHPTRTLPHNGGPRRSPRRFGGRPARTVRAAGGVARRQIVTTPPPPAYGRDNDDIHEQTRFPKDCHSDRSADCNPSRSSQGDPHYVKGEFCRRQWPAYLLQRAWRRQAAHSSSRGHQPKAASG